MSMPSGAGAGSSIPLPLRRGFRRLRCLATVPEAGPVEAVASDALGLKGRNIW